MTTYVLVHGAWHSGRCWDRVVPLLAAAGHEVHAPTLTGFGETAHLAGPEVGLETHVDDVVGLIEGRDLTDVVLVGHSYAGLVVSSVLDTLPERIAQLCYLDAMVPEDGETAVDVMPVNQRAVDQARDGWRVPPLPELPAPYGLFGVTDPDDVAWLRSMLSDLPVLCLQQKVHLGPGARAVPRTHIHNTVRPPGFEPRPVPPIQPNGEPSVVWELPTGHDCMVTMPRELSELLLRLAR